MEAEFTAQERPVKWFEDFQLWLKEIDGAEEVLITLLASTIMALFVLIFDPIDDDDEPPKEGKGNGKE